MTEHVMLDLETMGNGNNAAIVSIGAVKFTADEITDEFHVGVHLESSTALGLKIDADTVMWWLHPDRAEARQQLLNLEAVDLPSALIGFSEWFGEEKPIWGNGSTFDNVILRSAYAACQISYPARFWNDQCYRTLKYRAPGVSLVREGTHHNALDDARCQAKHLQAIMRQLGAADRHLVKLQDTMRDFLPPDAGQSEHEFANQIIELLDGPEQREVQGLGPIVL
jgi:DNA polymerase III epsilon subunit-like protein